MRLAWLSLGERLGCRRADTWQRSLTPLSSFIPPAVALSGTHALLVPDVSSPSALLRRSLPPRCNEHCVELRRRAGDSAQRPGKGIAWLSDTSESSQSTSSSASYPPANAAASHYAHGQRTEHSTPVRLFGVDISKPPASAPAPSKPAPNIPNTSSGSDSMPRVRLGPDGQVMLTAQGRPWRVPGTRPGTTFGDRPFNADGTPRHKPGPKPGSKIKSGADRKPRRPYDGFKADGTPCIKPGRRSGSVYKKDGRKR